jgi:hypothetical protein
MKTQFFGFRKMPFSGHEKTIFRFRKIGISRRQENTIISFPKNRFFRAPRKSDFFDFRKIAFSGRNVKKPIILFPKNRFLTVPRTCNFLVS